MREQAVERSNAPIERVRELLEMLPGLTVTATYGSTGIVRAGFVLKVSNPRTLAKLVHLGCAMNMPVRAEVDEKCGDLYQHDDPNCVRYTLSVPWDDADKRGCGILLIEELLMEEVEGRKR